MTFNVQGAKQAGYSDKEIEDFLSKKESKKEPIKQERKFDVESAKKAGYSDKEIENFLAKNKPKIEEKQKPNEPFTVKGAATQFGAGLGGGAGGIGPDIANMVEPFASLSSKLVGVPAFDPVSGITKGLSDLTKITGAKGTEELTQGFAGQEPQNSAERILRSGGQFGGQEGILGAAVGGPPGALAGSIHGTASGLLYGGLKEVGVPDEWALGLTALTTLSPIAARELWPKLVEQFKAGATFNEAKKAVLPEGLKFSEKIGPGTVFPEAKGAFEEKEAILSKLQERPQGKPLPFEPKFGETTGEASSLKGRVTEEPSLKPIRGTPETKELGEAISKEAFETEAQAGRTISGDIKEAYKAEREIVTEKYKKAEEVTSTHDAIHPDLAKQNEERIHKLERLEKRSAGEEAVYQDALALRRMIGTPEALIEVNSGRLMKQANSFSQKVKYELPYAGYKGEIKNIVHEMNESVIGSLKLSGKNPNAVLEADRTYANFANRFMGDEISPFLQKKILSPEQLSRKAISDEATYRAVKYIFGNRDLALINKIDRELVHSKMDKYYLDPSKVNSKEYIKDLKNIAERIGKEKTSKIDHILRQKQLNEEKKLFKRQKLEQSAIPKKSVLEKKRGQIKEQFKIEEPLAKTPEESDKFFKNRSSIKQLRKQMKEKGLEKEFERLKELKLEEIFKEGGFGEKKITGSDLKRIIEKDHEVLVELLGQEEVASLNKVAAKAGREELTQEIVKDILKAAGKMTLQTLGLGKVLKLLPLKHI
jgi:hypothetical protein